MPKVRIIQMGTNGFLFEQETSNDRNVVQTCGFIPLAWAAMDDKTLTVCVQTPPYCIVRDQTQTLWLHDRKPYGDLGMVVWRRADAVDLAVTVEEASNV